LSPEFLLSVSLYMVADARRRGYKHLLESFWDEAQSFNLPLPQEDPVSAASFCEARLKLKPELFSDLLTEVWKMQRASFDDSCRWHGKRVFAVDGSKINLNRSFYLGRHFHYPPGGRSCTGTPILSA